MRVRSLNPGLWVKALRVIPSVSPRQWRELDPVARWLIASRAAVLVMTVSSGLMAGLLALRDGVLRIGAWALLVPGLALAHATNNLFNDYTDFRRGVDRDDYLRTRYGPQPLAHGLMSKRQLLGMSAATGALALACGAALAAFDGWDPFVGVLMGLGVLFVLFYTWPLKYLALGELAVLVVWGPLMVGGGYYVLARAWSWEAAWASVSCALGATAVLLGKHIDKIDADRQKRIRTLPSWPCAPSLR
jgi:1,4-dihydroxy-2-naphthoate octaprenyltransferase